MQAERWVGEAVGAVPALGPRSAGDGERLFVVADLVVRGGPDVDRHVVDAPAHLDLQVYVAVVAVALLALSDVDDVDERAIQPAVLGAHRGAGLLRRRGARAVAHRRGAAVGGRVPRVVSGVDGGGLAVFPAGLRVALPLGGGIEAQHGGGGRLAAARGQHESGGGRGERRAPRGERSGVTGVPAGRETHGKALFCPMRTVGAIPK